MDFIKNNYKTILLWFGLVCLIFIIVNYFYNRQEQAEQKLQQAITLSEQQVTNINVLQNELKISKQNAELLASAIQKAQTNQVQPNTYITVQAPTIAQAATDVKERIDKKDTTLPPAALENTDRTVVAPQPDNEEYAVGVYKINTYRNWYVGAGIGVHNNDWYVPVSLQRNYAKDKAVELQLHLDPRDKSIDGGQIMYKRSMNKLFYWF